MRALSICVLLIVSSTGCNREKIEGATAHCQDPGSGIKDKDFACKQCCKADLIVGKIDNGTGKMQNDKCVCAVE